MEFAPLSLIMDSVRVTRGERAIVEDFSLSIASGDLVWLRGANGVGKTSLLRIAAGLARPDAGSVSRIYGGNAVSPSDVTGFQGHKDAIKPGLSVIENIRFWAKLAGAKSRVKDALNTVGLTGRERQPAGTLSAGQSRRLALAQLWISDKPLWILDEPAAAIDTDGQALIDNLVISHIARGGAVMLASHAAPRKLTDKARYLTLSGEMSL